MNESDLEGLSKYERKQLKKKLRAEQQELGIAKKTRLNKMKKIALYGIAVVFAIAAVFALFVLFSKTGASENAKIAISPSFFDFGGVSVRGGTVSASLMLSNEGKDDLVIRDIVTSCMCTSAKLSFAGRESPLFGMHSNNLFFGETIPPGQSAELKIFYDPTVHPDLRGAVTRVVSIYSNDASAPKKDIVVEASQVS